MEQFISKAIKSGVITFDSICRSWSTRKGAAIDPDVLDAVLSVEPKWLEKTIHPSGTYPRFELISRDMFYLHIHITEISLLGLSIAWNDTAAETVIKKHLASHKLNETPVAKIEGENKLYIDIDIKTLREILALLNNEKGRFYTKRDMFTQKFVELGLYLDGYFDRNRGIRFGKRFFTPEVTDKIEKLLEKPWLLQEVIRPKEIPHCPAIKGMSCISAEKIIIRNEDMTIDLAELWPEQKLVVVTNSKNKRIMGFAPILDNDDFKLFTEEFHAYYNRLSNRPDKRSVIREVTSVAQTSLSLCCWLKEHCAEKLDK